MKKILIVSLILFITVTTLSALFYYNMHKKAEIKKRKVAVGMVFDKEKKKGYMFVGSPEEVSKGKEMDKLVDPVVDIAINAENEYRKGNYSEAREEALKALRLARHGIVKHMAHNTLLKIYEATDNYKPAIQEIDWLLTHVNEHAKPDLLKKKAELERTLNKTK